MEQRTEDESLIRRYLLGRVTESEQETVEVRLMTDRPYFEQFLRLEEALTDEYVGGHLNEAERERFENHFMRAPGRRESVEFAATLKRYVSEPAPPDPASPVKNRRLPFRRGPASAQGWPAAAVVSLFSVALLLLTAGILLTVKLVRLREDNERARAAQASADRAREALDRRLDDERARGDELARRLAEAEAQLRQKEQQLASLNESGMARPAATGRETVSLTLEPGMDRGAAGVNRTYLPASVQRLRLKVGVRAGEYKSYRAEVRTPEGETIWEQAGLKSQGGRNRAVVAVELPASRLKGSDYLMILSGNTAGSAYEVAGTYHFRVVKKQP